MRKANTNSLCEHTLTLLRKSKTPLPDLAQQAGLPFYWLKSFKSGTIKDPSVNRVQQLYEYLTGKKLAV
jgi:hypothetical protein